MKKFPKVIDEINEKKDIMKMIKSEIIQKYSSLDINKFDYYQIGPTSNEFKEEEMRGFKSIHHPKSRKMESYIVKKPILTALEKKVIKDHSSLNKSQIGRAHV